MATAEGKEPGYVGQLISLAGVKGVAGQGRATVEDTITLVGAGLQFIVPANPKRIALLVQNHYSSDSILKFSLGGANATTAKSLQIGDTLIIDALFPWTGMIRFDAPAGANNVIVYTEISVS